MSEFISFAQRIEELSSTLLIVSAAIFFAFKYLPSQMKQQGEINEIIRNNSVVIENCTTVLKMVSIKDDEIKQSLERIENHIHSVNRDLHDLKTTARKD